MNLSQFNVTFDSPSETSAGSLPLGNGDVAVNVWLEPGGDILLYIAKSDAWDEHGRLIKVGRVRARLSPNPFTGSTTQTLDLERGTVVIEGGDARVTIHVDAHRPVVWLEADGEADFEVVRDSWRGAPRELPSVELHCIDTWNQPVTATADHVLMHQGRQTWYHRNEVSLWRPVLSHQSLDSFADSEDDPLLHRTFGATIFSKKSGAGTRCGIAVHCDSGATPESWLAGIDAVVGEAAGEDPEAARSAHDLWWREFWGRSHIEVTSSFRPTEGECVTAAYVYQRYLSACAGRGAFPIKFNGSLFTADWGITSNFQQRPEHTFDTDYRRWGGAYWFQNTRLPYWPMLAAGDYEFMKPLFRMYVDALPLAEERSRIWFGHDGAFFPETMYFFGAHLSGDYGLDRTGKAPRDVQNGWIGLQRCAILELLALGLDYFDHTKEAAFLSELLLPLARAALTFYADHYKRDASGSLVLQPAQAIEAFWNVRNPTPDLAGLHHVVPRLLQLDDVPEKEMWSHLLEALPPLPVGTLDDKPVILPAEQLIDPTPHNSENPELYAVFPYRLFSRTRDLETGRWTFVNRTYQDTHGWYQDAIQAACLGLATTAKQFLLKNCRARSSFARFPGFFGPNIDWVPDQDHGGVSVIALQSMLLQTDGDKILLFPAWPADWDVDFKLHAPGGTVIHARVKAGVLEHLNISPSERAKDVINYFGASTLCFS